MTLADLFQIAETGASDAERTADAAQAAYLHRASLLDLHRTRKNAKRWSSAATVATLTAEINRRLTGN